MVKSKAEISLDEWLAQGVRLPEPTTPKTSGVSEGQVRKQDASLVYTVTEAKPAQSAAAELAVGSLPMDINQAQATVTEVEAHEWFWLLLEQAGYERWWPD